MTDPEQLLKKETLEADFKATPAEPLQTVRRLQSKAKEGGAFAFPASLAVAEDGVVYVSDNNAQAIHYAAPDSDVVNTLQTQGGEGKLNWPTTIRVAQDALFVTDNDGLKVYQRDGALRRVLKTYYGVNHFAVRPDGSFYVNPAFSHENTSNPLVVELNGDGTRVREFGERLNRAEHIGLEDRVYLADSKKYLVVVYKHLPRVRLYQPDGKLAREFEVTHPLFEEFDDLGRSEFFTRPKPNAYRLPKYIAGASVVGDRVLVLLDLPQPEVVEFDFEGRELGRYRGEPLPTPTLYLGFDAKLAGDTYHFWTIASDAENFMSLMEFTAAKKR